MAGQIKIDTAQVDQIASNIDGLNKKLFDLLQNSQKSIQGLANSWQGSAAESTINSTNEFAAKYFQNYHDVIDNYVKFLRNVVSTDYTTTETSNIKLADAFK